MIRRDRHPHRHRVRGHDIIDSRPLIASHDGELPRELGKCDRGNTDGVAQLNRRRIRAGKINKPEFLRVGGIGDYELSARMGFDISDAGALGSSAATRSISKQPVSRSLMILSRGQA